MVGVGTYSHAANIMAAIGKEGLAGIRVIADSVRIRKTAKL